MKNSIKATARIGGLLYLINIVLGIFAIGYVSSVVVVNGDAAVTAQNILAQELFYRSGFVAHIIILLTNIPLAVIFYQLFKVVNKNASLLVVFFSLVGTAIEAASLLSEFAPLALLKNVHYQAAFGQGQLQSLAYMFQELEATGFNVALVFFGCYCISIGYLVFNSTFLPRIIGVFMTIGGICYLINSFANFLSPGFASGLFPYIQMPSGLAELSLCLWLLIAGLNVARWQEKAVTSAGHFSNSQQE